jgi:hypothetical protein
MRRKVIVLLALLYLASPEGVRSQVHPVQISASERRSQLGFERLLNTFTWKNDLFYSAEVGGLTLDLRQRLRSRLIRSEQRSIQDELVDTLDLRKKLSDGWNLQAQATASLLSDHRAVDLGELAQYKGLVGVQVFPTTAMSIAGLAGFEHDSQQEESDRGFAYMLEAQGREIEMEDFRAFFATRWMQSFLSPRRPASGGVELNIVRDFGTGAVESVSFEYTHQRREFYTRADDQVARFYDIQSNIFRRDANGFRVTNHLTYQAFDRARLEFEAGLSSRTITRGLRFKVAEGPAPTPLDTKVQEMQLFGSLKGRLEISEWIGADVSIAYAEREERHTLARDRGASDGFALQQERNERKLNNIARRTSLASQIRTILSTKDQLNFAGSAAILRYDTPDTLNIDDRDELLISLGVQSVHQISEQLELRFEVDATLSHLVYLHRLQSANNNWNRILRFSPSVRYAPSDFFRTANHAEVLANYTVYDFEEQVALTRSFSFRQASWTDTTSLRLTARLTLDVFGTVRVYERGVLLWSDFRERPQNYFVEQTYWPRCTYYLMASMELGIGYRWFRQDRYRYERGDRSKERSLTTSGPTVVFRWRGEAAEYISLEGWREVQRQDGLAVRTVPNLSLTVSMAL